MSDTSGTSSDSTGPRLTAGLSRRHALTGAAGLGLALPLLTACGGSGSDSGAGGSSGSPTPASGALGPASDVPVGGGTIYADAKVVVTQPTKGDFRGFSSACTHQGCPVTSVQDGSIDCLCHGSKFSIEDGSVQAGPATRALGQVPLTVKAGEIRAG